MVNAVIFDIDNTLYDYDAAHSVAFRALTDYAGEKLGVLPEQFATLHQEANRVLKQRVGMECAAIHNRLLRYQIILELLGQPIFHAPRMERLYWSTLMDAATPSPGALDCLHRLKEAGVCLGTGTDMTADWQYDKLEQFGMLTLFDFMVSSEEVTAEKPAEKLFRLCLEKAGCAPQMCAFVGDSLPKDVCGAQKVGMRPIWYCPQEKTTALPAGVLRVRRLDEVPSLLL